MAYSYHNGKEILIVRKERPKSVKFSKSFRRNRIGRKGNPTNSTMMGKCADCDKSNKLVGFICRSCYLKRNKRHKYQTDKAYRNGCLERTRKWRVLHGQAQQHKPSKRILL
jgi:hypothetical protein